jgi:hypothetical protein
MNSYCPVTNRTPWNDLRHSLNYFMIFYNFHNNYPTLDFYKPIRTHVMNSRYSDVA